MSSTSPDALAEILALLRQYRGLGEGAIAQVGDRELFQPLDEQGNSIAVIVKHLRGNMLSRWRDFLTTDGEKPDRDRDSEFVLRGEERREVVLAWWEEGWAELFRAVEPLAPADLDRVVTIRGEPHTVLRALLRQLTHYAYHVGQIVMLARHHRGEGWQSLSMPRRKDALELLRERLAGAPEALPFAEAVVTQLTGPVGPLHGATSDERDALVGRVAELVLGEGAAPTRTERLLADHALTAAFFQNIDLLYLHGYPDADDVGRVVMRVLHRWHPESLADEEP